MILNSTLNFLFELFLVVTIILFGTVSSIIISASFLKMLVSYKFFKNHTLITLGLYLYIIVILLYIVRLFLMQFISNFLLVQSGFVIVGPIIGVTLLNNSFVTKFMHKTFINNILKFT